MKQTRVASQLTQEMKTIKNMSKEFIEMFQALEEGIIVIKDNVIDFSNDLFKEILTRIHLEKNLKSFDQVLDEKIFKVFREGQNEESSSSQDGGKKVFSANVNESHFSLNDLIQNKKSDFFNDKIFEIKIKKEDNDQKFKYVQIKTQEVKDSQCKGRNKGKKILVQLIDVSDKMLYNEVKAEQEFLTLINATVSHELRNPLSSLVGQINHMQFLFETFGELLTQLRDEGKVHNDMLQSL
jgi:hypothetical protein